MLPSISATDQTDSTRPALIDPEVAKMATISSAFVGGVGGSILGVVGAITTGYSTIAASAVAFGCAGAVIGTGGAALLCVGAIGGVVWLDAKIRSMNLVQDELNQAPEEFVNELQQLPASVNAMLLHTANQVELIAIHTDEQHRHMNASLHALDNVAVSASDAVMQLSNVAEPLRLATDELVVNVTRITDEIHHLQTELSDATNALQQTQKSLSATDERFSGTVNAFSVTQVNLTQQILEISQKLNSLILLQQRAQNTKINTSLNDDLLASKDAQISKLVTQNQSMQTAMHSMHQKLSAATGLNEPAPHTFTLFRKQG